MNHLRLVRAPSVLPVLATLLLAACSGAPPGSAPAPTPAAAEVAAPETAVTTQPAAHHGPAGWFFNGVLALDLRDDQRASVAALQSELTASLGPQRQALRQEIVGLADALERGELDQARAEEQKVALRAALVGSRSSFVTAINGVHDTLDEGQRVALVESLRQQHERHVHPDAAHAHGLAKLAFELGLTEAQQRALSDAMGQGLDDLFPGRKTRREESEAKMRAMALAFQTDDFDAADYEIGDHAEEAIASSVAVASRVIDVSNGVLSPGQRSLFAGWLRSKTEEL